MWRLWQCVCGQWRAGFGGAYALDYAAVDVSARWLGLDLRIPRLRRGLQALERQWLASMAERQERGEGE